MITESEDIWLSDVLDNVPHDRLMHKIELSDETEYSKSDFLHENNS
jgi:hypothetical protein